MRMRDAFAMSFVSHVTTISANIIVVPIWLHVFGIELYGFFWGSLMGLTAYLSLLNLGIAQTVSSSLSTIDRSQGPEAMTRIIRIGIGAFVKICGISLPMVAIAAWLAPWATIFHFREALSANARLAALALGVTFLLELPFTVIRAALVGLGEVSTERTISIGVTLLRLGVAGACALAPPPLWVAVVALSLVSVAGHLVCGVFVWKHIREVRSSFQPTVQQLPPPSLPSMRSRSIHYSIVQVGLVVIYGSDALLAGILLGAKDAASISIGIRVLAILSSISALSTPVLGPKLARAWADGNRQQAADLALRSMQVIMALTVAIVLILLTAGQSLISHWAGSAVFMGSPAWILYCALAVVQAMIVLPWSFIQQAGLPHTVSFWAILEGVLKILATIGLVRLLGLPGIPLAAILTESFLLLRVMTKTLCEELEISRSLWITSMWSPSLLPCAAYALCWFIFRFVGHTQDPWHEPLAAAVGGTAFAAVFLGISAPQEIRRALVIWRRNA
jgi:O-antigen/teichoic acid export membrane protein